MKKLIFAILAVIFLSCTNQTDTVQVSFTGDKFGIESGQLKSFDINKWEHFHYPEKVVVTLVNTNNKTVFTTNANSGKVFFENGTNVIHVPVGTYICSVEGGGYPDNDNTLSKSYYMWSIKDTIININPNTDVIKFRLHKTSALVVKDASADIKLIAYRNAGLYFTGRGGYDFAYVTPGTYSGMYTDSTGYQVTTEWFNIKGDNYYYFVTPTVLKSTVNIPEFTKNEVKF